MKLVLPKNFPPNWFKGSVTFPNIAEILASDIKGGVESNSA